MFTLWVRNNREIEIDILYIEISVINIYFQMHVITKCWNNK